MAKVIAVDLEIDGGKSVQSLKLVEDELKDIERSLKEINASGTKDFEGSLKKLNKVADSGKLTWDELGKTIQQYQSIALSAGKESAIGKEALRRAGELKSEMDNLSRSVNSLATNGAQLNTALQMGQGVVAGYTAIQSATALIGVENEELVKTLVKLQAAQGLLASIEQVRFALEKDSLIVIKAKNFWEKATIVSTNLLAKANLVNAASTNAATVSTRIFTVALFAIPIIAIIGGLILLYQNFDKVSKGISNAVSWVANLGENFKKLSGWVKVLLIPFAPLILAFKGVTMALKELGIIETEAEKQIRIANEKIVEAYQKRGEEIDKLIIKHKSLVDNTKKQFDREIKLLAAQGESTEAIEKKKLATLQAAAEAEYNYTERRRKAFIREYNTRVDLGQVTSEQAKEHIEQLHELTKASEAAQHAVLDTANEYAVFRAKNIEAERKEAEQRAALRRAERDKIQAEKDKALEDRNKQLEADRIALLVFNNKREEDRDKEKLKQKEKEAKENEEAIKASIAYWKKRSEDELAVIVEANRVKKQIQDSSVEASLRAVNSLSMANDAALSNDIRKAGNNEQLKEKLRKESFERNKKLQYASALIDGFKAVTATLAQPLDPISKGILLASTIATSVATLAKIKSTNYESGGSIGSVTGGLSASSNSSSNTSQNTNNQPVTQTDISNLLSQNSRNNTVLVVDDFNKVYDEQRKIEISSTI